MDDASSSNIRAGGLESLVAYGLMIAATIALFLGIRSLGGGLVAPPPESEVARGPVSASSETLLHVLLALVVIILAARAVGAVFARLQQPAVIGEVIAGVVLGPSLLGRVAPAAYAYILPKTVAPYLGIIAQLGVILFMFLVGLELDTGLLRKKTHATLAISHASIIAPFLLGAGTALWVYPRLSTSDVPFGAFCMFLGVSMSITAFPVLARILTDRGIHKTRLGVIAISCAAVDDVTAWCLLAFVVAVVQSQVRGAAITFGLTIAYIVVMFGVVRPIVVRLVQRQDLVQKTSQTAVAAVFIGLLISALITEYIGIHAIFGAFLLGAIIPHGSRLAKSLTDKIEDLVVVLLLPAFFAFTGMRTQIGLVSGASQWLMCGALIVVACLGKFGGSTVAARLAGLSMRDAASLGILMNTRGLMELVVLNIGLDLGVVKPTLFAMLVIMAIVTTVATTPILHLLNRGRPIEDEEAAAAVGTG